MIFYISVVFVVASFSFLILLIWVFSLSFLMSVSKGWDLIISQKHLSYHLVVASFLWKYLFFWCLLVSFVTGCSTVSFDSDVFMRGGDHRPFYSTILQRSLSIGILIGIVMDLSITLGSINILMVLIFPILEHRISFHLFVFNFLHQYLIVFTVQDFHLLV